MVGEQLRSDYNVHKLPGSSSAQSTSAESLVINRALLARIEMLEAENASLKKQQNVISYFRIESIQHDDKLIRFYTGFVSYTVYLAFFEFLGPVVDHVNYWGAKEGAQQRYRSRKLDSKNQLFLTLVRLKLNIKLTDLAAECIVYLHMQSSTWSQYKHHNTVKFLVVCTPNGAICYLSPVYVGSVSDIELTHVCGFLTTLQDKPGI